MLFFPKLIFRLRFVGSVSCQLITWPRVWTRSDQLPVWEKPGSIQVCLYTGSYITTEAWITPGGMQSSKPKEEKNILNLKHWKYFLIGRGIFIQQDKLSSTYYFESIKNTSIASFSFLFLYYEARYFSVIKYWILFTTKCWDKS